MQIACSTAAFKTDLNAALQTVAALGFREVDLIAIGGWDHVNVPRLVSDFAQERDRVGILLQRHGLTPIAMNFAVHAPGERSDETKNAERRAQMEAVCRFMCEFGIRTAGFYPGYYDGSQTWSPPRASIVENSLATFREMLAVAAGFGVAIGPEIHFRTTFETPAQTRELFDAIPEITVVYDPSHFLLAGFSLEETGFMLDHAHHVHLRGAARGQMQAPFEGGGVDFRWLAGELRRCGYAGNFSIEYLPDFPGDVGAEICKLRRSFEVMATGEARSSP